MKNWQKVLAISLLALVICIAIGSVSGNKIVMILGAICMVGAGITIYFIPEFIAYDRDARNYTAIGWINFFFGWTLLGWVGCLIWALLDKTEGEVAESKYESTNKYDDLEKLQKLKDNGTITEAEFELEKAKILN